MRRNGFTMVELIFVIIIIGILSVAAIPKFGDIKDRAKASTEYGALSSLDSVISANMEMQKEDFDNIHVDWHNATWRTSLTQTYADINDRLNNSSVLGKILKKNENLEIVAYAEAGDTGADGIYDDILFIKGKASNATLGVKEADKTGSLNGKPDKTDVWVFNASPNDAIITYYDGDSAETKTIESGEITLIDLTAKASDTFVDTAAAVDAAGEISVKGVVGTNAAADLTIVDSGL